MKEIIGWFAFPFTYIYPFDRNRRHYVKYFGEYKPTPLKRLVCYLLDEKLFPIDWEEIPPYEENISNEDDHNFSEGRSVKIQFYECYTQPDMISQNNIYARRFVVGIGFIWLNFYLVKNYIRFQEIAFFKYLFYNYTSVKRILIFGWFYTLKCLMLINKNYQRPYN
jgi:hypothetical protein